MENEVWAKLMSNNVHFVFILQKPKLLPAIRHHRFTHELSIH